MKLFYSCIWQSLVRYHAQQRTMQSLNFFYTFYRASALLTAVSVLTVRPYVCPSRCGIISDVKLGQNGKPRNRLAEARATRPRPRTRPKIIMKKYQIIINNILFKIIAGKLTKFPNFTRFLPKNARLLRQRDRGKAEAKASRPRPRPRPKFWPQGHFGLENLTSLGIIISTKQTLVGPNQSVFTKL